MTKNSKATIRIDLVVDTAIEWLKRKLLAPISSYVTRFLLIAGAALLAWPAFEQIVLSAILKMVLGIDLGIEPPGVAAYAFGTLLMISAATYSFAITWVKADRDQKVFDAKQSVVKDLWELSVDAVYQTRGLVNAYAYPSTDANGRVEKARLSTLRLQTELRKHRPFILSEALYDEFMALADTCAEETGYCYGYLTNLKESYANLSPHRALKEAQTNAATLGREHDKLCGSVRNYVNSFSLS